MTPFERLTKALKETLFLVGVTIIAVAVALAFMNVWGYIR